METVFKLKKDSWHAKLMNWTWKISYKDFTHMCPYFWLSVINILIVPFVLIGRSIKYVVYGFLTKIDEYFGSRRQRKYDYYHNYAERLKKDNNFMDKFIILCEKKFTRIYGNLPYGNSELRQIITERREAYLNRVNEKKEQARVNSQTNKERINSILKKSKPYLMFFLYTIMAATVACIIYALAQLVIWLTTFQYNIDWPTFWTYMRNTALTIGGIISAAIVVVVIIEAYTVAKREMPCIFSKEHRFMKIMTIIVKPIAWLIIGIETIGSIIYSMYKNNCPPIDWE